MKNSIYKTYLGNLNGMNSVNIDEITNDCRIIYRKHKNKYIIIALLVPININKNEVIDRQK